MLDITVDVRDDRWKKAVRTYRITIERSCQAAYKSQGKRKQELAVVLADDAFIKELNHTYRGKNKPTNVLSFHGEQGSLGDIILAFETITQEADAQGKSLRHHMMHLLVHGVLHLMGYDHEEETQARKMEHIEIKILEKLGVSNPYLYAGRRSATLKA
ncbi:MAG: rRNA maturation RNase YbeY [Alphaproteobacteria bacterium]